MARREEETSKPKRLMIRPAVVQDSSEIARIHIDAWRSAYHEFVPRSYLESLEIEGRTKRWQRILAESQSSTFVLEFAGDIVGWVSYGESRDDDCKGDGEVWALYVSPRCWRHGYGRVLLDHVEKTAIDSQVTNLFLWVLEENKNGRKFYERVGYAFDGARKMVKIGGVQLSELRYKKLVGQE